ncbi:MAG TPA: hypothetical protein VMT96_01040 [Candidatus Bathyarchaeia archaeon]|nr:hypothetical protein [Candidatus Bathyarchaeia archaeon]
MAEKRCYFAHHVTDYDTEREQAAVEAITNHGYIVVNPNSPEDDVAYRERGMEYFVERVQGCDALAFQRFESGEIGAGVAKEIGTAVASGLPIYEVVDDVVVSILKGPFLDVAATRCLIKKVRESGD